MTTDALLVCTTVTVVVVVTGLVGTVFVVVVVCCALTQALSHDSLLSKLFKLPPQPNHELHATVRLRIIILTLIICSTK